MTDGPTGSALTGGRFAGPVRQGDRVLRTPGPNARNVQALLDHFERAGLGLTPRFLGPAEDGRELLGFVPGDAWLPPYGPELRSDATLVGVAHAIRRLHDASLDFVAPTPWVPGRYEVAGPSRVDCIGHGDLAPWNVVLDGPTVAAVIDWDTAGPTSRTWDLAYAAYQFVPFHPDDDLPAWGWETEPDRAARLRLFVESYGLGVSPAELVDLAIVRMVAIAAHMEQEIRAGNAAFDVQRDEGHPAGYRAGAAFMINARSRWLGLP